MVSVVLVLKTETENGKFKFKLLNTYNVYNRNTLARVI